MAESSVPVSGDELRARVVRVLPPKVLALLDRIEQFAGIPIQVSENSTALAAYDPNPKAPALEAGGDGATIFLRDLEVISPNGILHELLHLQRYWLEGVPQVVPKGDDDDRWKITSAIENTLEHLVIVPREAGYGFDPTPYWNATAQANWSAYPWPLLTKPFARQSAMLHGWVGIDLIDDAGARLKAETILRAERLYQKAEALRSKLQKLKNKKREQISLMLRALDIPTHEVELLYLDPRNRNEFRKPIG